LDYPDILYLTLTAFTPQLPDSLDLMIPSHDVRF
jgi:hypothetical protein